MLVLAHAGDWIAGALYVAPVALVAGWLAVASRRERRRDAEDASAEPDSTA